MGIDGYPFYYLTFFDTWHIKIKHDEQNHFERYVIKSVNEEALVKEEELNANIILWKTTVINLGSSGLERISCTNHKVFYYKKLFYIFKGKTKVKIMHSFRCSFYLTTLNSKLLFLFTAK